MGELAKAWTLGFQQGGPANATFLQGIVTLKHMDANSLENSDLALRTDFNVNVPDWVLADYYLRPFKMAIRDAGAKGV